jgi:uroporphyrinogen III methyltransferase/synthase
MTGVLHGRTVVITRAKAQSAALSSALAARGATVVEVPVLAVAPPADGGAALREAVQRLDTFAWVVLTSPNGVDAFVEALEGAACRAAVAVVGSGTAARCAQHGLDVALVPGRFVAEGLVEAFPSAPSTPASTAGARVLVAQAEAARDVVVLGLAAKGWDVTAVVAYRSVPAAVGPDAIAAARRADAIAFTSGSTVEHYAAAAGLDAVPPVVACIGPVTADAARAHGLVVSVVAEPHTIEGLVGALVAHFASQGSPEPSVDSPA